MVEPDPSPKPFSFIVRLWAGRNTPLRGRVTRVAGSGHDEHRPVTRLGQITLFIGESLEREGVRLGLGWRVGRWLASLSKPNAPEGGERESKS